MAGWSTRAPKYASSWASAKDMWETVSTSATTPGSALRMPSTSVQIWTSSASRQAPTMAAEKSDPPRPSVATRTWSRLSRMDASVMTPDRCRSAGT